MHVHFSVKSQLSLIKGSNKGMDVNKKKNFFMFFAFSLHTMQHLALKDVSQIRKLEALKLEALKLEAL